MFELFSTREIAIGTYFILLLLFLLLKKATRKSVKNVIVTALNKQLVIPFIVLILYASLLIYAFTFLPFWEWKYLKDVGIWVLFTGVPVCYNAVNTKESNYFKNILLDNFKFSAITEFITGTFTFPLHIEFIIQPAIAILVFFQVFTEKKEQYKNANNFFNFLVALTGFLIIFFTIREAIVSFNEVGSIDLFVSFFIPIVFSIAYIPVAYLFALYAKYQILFMRVYFCTDKNKNTLRHRKTSILLSCGLSYKKIQLFEKEYLSKMYIKQPKEEFESIMIDFKKSQKNN